MSSLLVRLVCCLGSLLACLCCVSGFFWGAVLRLLPSGMMTLISCAAPVRSFLTPSLFTGYSQPNAATWVAVPFALSRVRCLGCSSCNAMEGTIAHSLFSACSSGPVLAQRVNLCPFARGLPEDVTGFSAVWVPALLRGMPGHRWGPACSARLILRVI